MPIDVKCHRCNKQYRLKDEMSGEKFKCKDCGEVVLAEPFSVFCTSAETSVTCCRT
jgi:hypothetical protein